MTKPYADAARERRLPPRFDIARDETVAAKLGAARQLILSGEGPVSITTIEHHPFARAATAFDTTVTLSD